MNAGKYKEKIVIEKVSCEFDEIGNQIEVWSEYYKCYAYVNNLYGNEYWMASQVQSEETVVFTTRYHKKINEMNTKEYRLIHRNKIYNIKFIDNVRYENDIVRIRAKAKE